MHLHHTSRTIGALLLVGALVACGDQVTGPPVITPDRDPALEAERRASHSLQWNAAARALVSDRLMDPPRASRAYALLAVAQHATLIAAAGREESPGASRPLSLGAALVAASSHVLRQVIPGDGAAIGALERQDLAALSAAGVLAEDIAAGEALGRKIAERVLAHAASDGSAAAWTGTVPQAPGSWYSSAVPAAPPLLPAWSDLRTWLLDDPAQ